MFKYALIFSIVSYCASAPRLTGTYTELILSQRFAITQFFYEYVHFPYVYTESDKYKTYLASHRTIFEAQRWTIHGLWAYHSKDKFHRDCIDLFGRRLEFNRSLLNNDLKEQLKAKWPILTVYGTEESEWETDYLVSGSCVTENVTLYFQKALRLSEQFDVGVILSNATIYPGGKYKLRHIIDSVTSALKSRVIVRCLTAGNPLQQYLLEIRICFNRIHNIGNCEHSIYSGDIYPCYSNKLVIYPLVPEGYF